MTISPAKISSDFVIVGGGIFGIYAALYLAKKGLQVCLIEKEKQLFSKASVVNQARLHSGYHYPRSIATARMSDENKARFTREHRDFIHTKFDKYYAIDRFGSLTDGRQFERFCAFIDIKCERIKRHELFDFSSLEALYLTEEFTFDPYLIADYYTKQCEAEKRISIIRNCEIIQAETQGNQWLIKVRKGEENTQIEILTPAVLNASYAGSNSINRLFGQEHLNLQYEIAEMSFVSSKILQNIGLTVMDGQFGSLMPYGKSGLHSLSSVAYTHHKVSREKLPTFDCQKKNTTCRPDYLSDCNFCTARPDSAYSKMSAQMKSYFSKEVDWQYFSSKFTVKAKLAANHIDDGRPTEVVQLQKKPDFYCIFAGKINSIYEVEKVLEV